MQLSMAAAIVQLLVISCPVEGRPKNYHAPRAASPIEIDGNIYKKAWEDIPWSEDFVEIRGDDAPKSARPGSGVRTRMKMAWDDDFLYIAAEMNAQNWPIQAEFTDRNEPIFQKDSDFEVFLDTDGSNANYKELELNAKNTVWNLVLDKPYSSGGAEHSGRVAKPGEAMYWDVKGQKTAAKMYGHIGTKQPDGKWTAEIALSHRDSLARTTGTAPEVRKFWRINFSRVEKKGEINWVWSPQMIWTPTEGKYQGQVNMHAPDAWGYVVFVEAGSAFAGTRQDWVDPNWNTKAAAHQLFYAEKLAIDPKSGGKLLSPAALKEKKWISPTLFSKVDVEVKKTGKGWKAEVQDAACIATIHEDNRLSQECSSSSFAFLPLRYGTLGCVAIIVIAGVGWTFRHKLKPNSATD